ncbi:substrate-binding domain-containing protein [Aestuariivirga sp. YIM B02566]|uniref:Substrate-binding domain-containing protein n=1 Tax=Taklimakanibacter albus TaxID=2800327 RepID=A0ACC5R5J4_9HYPH|nr:substrate-binding domain-containing protein [Aestuariivirga sp. YIM B02566]MBK1867927.1 substrate-binding domain-containing protein [Aestuariivirga sp. YIM B02566]
MVQNKTFVSAQQVAEFAGVSRSAVSRTFTEGASVSEATRKKVLHAAETLGYHVNHLARSLINEKSGIVCLIGADISTPYQGRIVETMTRRLQAINRVAMIINTSSTSESVEAALRQTLNYRAEATIVLSGKPPASLIKTCVNSGQHVILINRDDPVSGPTSITLDNQGAAREAFHMLKRAGCRNFAVISSEAGTPSLVGRETAFVKAAKDAGFTASATRLGPTAYASGYEAGRLVLARHDRPDGVFCVTDLMACGFMDAARTEFALAIPEDLCVVGFDDIDQASWASYNLTTFRQPIEQIADHAVALLSADEPEARGPIAFQAPPVWRRSVRPR